MSSDLKFTSAEDFINGQVNYQARFIAAMDHSGGSTGGVLDRYQAPWNEHNKMETVHAMRLRMVNSPDFNDKNIWGAILYQDTVTRGMVNILDEKGIDTFLKIDSGCDADGTLKQFPVKQMFKHRMYHSCTVYNTTHLSAVDFRTNVVCSPFQHLLYWKLFECSVRITSAVNL